MEAVKDNIAIYLYTPNGTHINFHRKNKTNDKDN